MSVGELAKLFAVNPLAAYAALTTLAIVALGTALILSLRQQIRTAQLHAYDLAKMMELHSRTLDVLGRVYGVLELPSVHKLLNGGGRRHRGNE